MIAFMKVWQNMHPSCSFVLHSKTLDVATDISCTVMAEQKNGDEGNAAHVIIMEDINKVPYCYVVTLLS